MKKAIKKLVSTVLAAAICVSIPVSALAGSETLVCQRQEHEHTDECYKLELSCGQDEYIGHQHGDDCYEVEKTLVCGVEEGSAHVHSDSCYTDKVTYICGQEESQADAGHTHSETCYDEEGTCVCGEEERPAKEGHTHTEACIKTEKVLSCTISTEPHVHTDACYASEKKLICTKEEMPGHTHTSECYERVGGPLCGKEEHTHTDECYADTRLDVENNEIWDHLTDDVEMSGIWMDDIIGVAKSQLGYVVHQSNYIIDDTGLKRGYTRFGHWYNVNVYGVDFFTGRYEDWCADFASFCLYYAGVSTEYFPLEKGCNNWIKALKEKDLFIPNETGEDGLPLYIPKKGDLIFFEMTGDGMSDHVGIVNGIEKSEEEGKPDFILTIEGNSNASVREDKYRLNDWRVMGYGDLSKAYNKYMFDLATNLIRDAKSTDNTVVSKDGHRLDFLPPDENSNVSGGRNAALDIEVPKLLKKANSLEDLASTESEQSENTNLQPSSISPFSDDDPRLYAKNPDSILSKANAVDVIQEDSTEQNRAVKPQLRADVTTKKTFSSEMNQEQVK